METRDYTLSGGKDSMEVVDLIDAILENILNKVPVAQWMNLTDELFAAVEGMNNLPVEMKSTHRNESITYLQYKMLERLWSDAAVVPEAPEAPAAPAE